VHGELSVSKSKTQSGTGRTIPFTTRVCGALTLWLSRLPGPDADSFVFPRHQVGFGRNNRETVIYAAEWSRPVSEWKSASYRALDQATLDYRWHDLRHTFITRFLEIRK